MTGNASAVPIARAAGALRHQQIAFLLMAAFFIVAPLVIYPVFLMKVMCFALFACAFNLLIGYVGLLSFGHAMFFGIAGYATAHSAKVWGFTPELAVLFGTASAGVLGLLAGLLAIRRLGIYFAMITLALAQMLFFFCLQAPFTGGEDGIQAVPRGRLFGIFDLSDAKAMYPFVLAIFLGGFLLIYRIVHSPFGQVLKAIRENESRAVSLGYDVERYKLLAFVLSAAIPGMVGGVMALRSTYFVAGQVFDPMISVTVIAMALLGGGDGAKGPLLGVLFLALLSELLWAQAPLLYMVILGAILIVFVLLIPNGLLGWWEARVRRRAGA
jgi:branched-chain amino acid transport system permease protein